MEASPPGRLYCAAIHALLGGRRTLGAGPRSPNRLAGRSDGGCAQMFLERWTVDELMDNTVSVARAAFKNELDPGAQETVLDAVLRIELREFTPDDWGDEFRSMFDRTEIVRQIGRRNAAPEMVARAVAEEDDARALFEGQVFWVLTLHRLPSVRRGRPIGPPDTGWFFRQVASGGSASDVALLLANSGGWDGQTIRPGQVIDVSQAARLAVKAEYQRVVVSQQGEDATSG